MVGEREGKGKERLREDSEREDTHNTINALSL